MEIGLYYNRFRYYDPEQGNYTQIDPIGLAGNNPTSYGYVSDPNTWIDPFGLSKFVVSAQTAVTDMLSRGVHVNVEIPNSKPIHVGLRPDHQGGFKFVPADPKAKEIFEKRPDMWKKIAKSVQEYISKPINADRLSKAAGAAKREYPTKVQSFLMQNAILRR